MLGPLGALPGRRVLALTLQLLSVSIRGVFCKVCKNLELGYYYVVQVLNMSTDEWENSYWRRALRDCEG